MRVFGEQAQGQGVHRVAGQDRVRDAEQGPCGGAVAAGGVAVHHVVVQEGEVVDQFDGGGQADRGRGGGAERSGGGQY